MLSHEEYRELLRYRDAPVPQPAELPYITSSLLSEGLIMAVQRHEISVKDTIQIERILPCLIISEKGKFALREFEENAHAEDKEKAKSAEKHTPDGPQIFSNRQKLMQEFAIATLSAIVAGLFLIYWPAIASVLAEASDKVLQVIP